MPLHASGEHFPSRPDQHVHLFHDVKVKFIALVQEPSTSPRYSTGDLESRARGGFRCRSPVRAGDPVASVAQETKRL